MTGGNNHRWQGGISPIGVGPKTLLSLLTLAAVILWIGTMEATDGERRTVAVVYFENNSVWDKETLDPLRKGLADMLITEMSKIQQLAVVERSRLQSLMEELKLSLSDVVDEKTALKVGKLLGAQTLLFGGFVNMFGGEMRIDARIVETETGLTLKAEEETDKADKLFEMVKKLTKKIAKDLDVKLTKEDKKRLEETDNESFQATILYSKGLEFQDRREYTKALEMYKKALDINPKYTKAKMRIEEIEALLE